MVEDGSKLHHSNRARKFITTPVLILADGKKNIFSMKYAKAINLNKVDVIN